MIRRAALVFCVVAAFEAGCTAGGHRQAPDTPLASATSSDAKVAWAVAGEWRDSAAKARDVYRHPRETLAFFGLRDDMHVVEIVPGSGWYTAILAPVLAEHGKLTITSAFDGMQNHADLYGKVVVSSPPGSKEILLGPNDSADLVLTFRNMHNWVGRDGQVDVVLGRVFKVLKRGGTFGLVDHRSRSDAEPPGSGGYLREDWVIAKVESAGLHFVAKSAINSNPKDTKDYPRGVWTLPPTYVLGDVDRAKYETIGESDRMTLKFIKP